MYSAFARAAGDIAREAGEFLKHFSDGHSLQVENKGSDYDFVTNADRQSQRLVADRLKAAFPDHGFVGEEDGLSDAEVAKRLMRDEYCWVCDPLDGTVNYIHHLGIYAVSVGLVRAGTSVAGAIYLPESGELFTAARGAGAFMNGRPIRANEGVELRRAFLSADLASADLEHRGLNYRRMSLVAENTSGMRVLGSACAAMARVACGRQDGYWNVGLHAWDVAAGIVIVEEAGGEVADAFGAPFHYDMQAGCLATAPGLSGAIGALIRRA